MNLRLNLILAAWLALASFVVPMTVQADAGQPIEADSIKSQALQPCPQRGDKKLDLAQTSPADCCKGNKGVCGCRAGKIICCDRTASEQPGCTCHGDDGFLE